MASKSLQPEPEKLDLDEALDVVDKTMDRVKSLYEQFFLGIQKQPPTFLHTDLERKLRDLSQIQIRNTALRYRFVTLQQKFGSYHAYWRRTLRQIENGTYARSLSKLGRKAALTGEEIPEEILAAMPKRMREQVRRDREAALALAQRRNQLPVDSGQNEGDFYDEFVTPVSRVDPRGAHVLDEGDADLDLDAYFKQVADETAEATYNSAPPERPSDLDQFENIVTPPRAPPPSAPATLRAGALGFGPRQTTSPNLRVPNRAATEPGTPGPTPPPIAPQNTPPSLRPPGQAPAGRPSAPAIPPPPARPGSLPAIPAPGARVSDPNQPVVGAKPLGRPAGASSLAPSQITRPNPIAAGAASAAKPATVETMSGPFAREPSTMVHPRRSKRDTDIDGSVDVPMEPTPRPSEPVNRPATAPPPTAPPRAAAPARPVGPSPSRPNQAVAGRTGSNPAVQPARRGPPPGMTEDDVNTLYAKYVKAKEMVGETTGPQTYGKLLNTINAQAPKIMEQYKAKGVDFSVVVKDNQVIIKAKPK